MGDRLADAIDEARRGLWRSAAESFAIAAAASPDPLGPRLAQAICLLNMGEPETAVVLLETSIDARTLAHATAHGRERHAWLCAAARLAAGDVQGAEQAAAHLPRRLGTRVLAHTLLAGGNYESGVRALLVAFARLKAPART